MIFPSESVIFLSVIRMEWKIRDNDIVVICDNFDAAASLDCGQAFRWVVEEDGTCDGFAVGKHLRLRTNGNETVFFDTSKEDFENIWINYFDFNRDYAEIISKISGNEVIKEAIRFSGGIRVLRQEPWETLCSFIISQNNNIPRIKGIIARLCENFGDKCGDFYSFPTAERLADLNPEDLAPLRCGFRARYIIDAARKVSSGEVDLQKLFDADTDYAQNELMKICGVGAKVADCTLLFGLGHIEALPKDVWIKRALEKLFGGTLPAECEPYAGIVQQYIFQYARLTKLDI